MNWSESIKAFKSYLILERGLSENTLENYIFDVQKLIAYFDNHNIKFCPTKVDSDQLLQFIYETAKNVKPSSQSRLLSGLRSFFDFLITEGLRDNNPVTLVEPPKIGITLPITLSVSEVEELIKSFAGEKLMSIRNRCILEMLYSCGLRVSELVNLRCSDLFFEESLIKVIGKGDKERFVPIGRIGQETVNHYLSVRVKGKKGHSDVLFLNNRRTKLTRNMIFVIVKKAAALAGIQKKIGPHSLRHSFATHLVENGADISSVQQMLGHSSITTTERYLHISKKHLKQTINQFHPRS
ncbi:MAG: tyrosine recombinase XerD [Flavobacteriales bacterium]|nr:tyrosine recombinase XerD [Flavobacteriales bacterium]